MKSKLPVSAIIPHMPEKRGEFFQKKGLPSIKRNYPEEIIVIDREGTAPEKRNEGFIKSKMPFVIFCDDDTVLRDDCLVKMFDAITRFNVDFVYSNFKGVVYQKAAHPYGKTYTTNLQDFNPNDLWKTNYIDTTSLIRREKFPGFDETLEKYQDWELWLHMVRHGCVGKRIKEVLFEKHFFDTGITMSGDTKKSMHYIRRKHLLRYKLYWYFKSGFRFIKNTIMHGYMFLYACQVSSLP